MKQFIIDTIIKAGEIVVKSHKNIIQNKGAGGNFALEADLASEQFILKSILKKYPQHKILAEETVNQINHPEKEESLWIVDPLDGTTNAKNGIPFFGLSIAYMQQGLVKFGAIYDPIRKELFSAEKQHGAFFNQQQLKIKNANSLDGLIINIGSPYSQKDFVKTYPLGIVFHQHGARIVNFGSAALECAWVTNNRLGAYFEAGLKPWDIAAASLLITEAGGQMIDPYHHLEPFSIFKQKAVLVGCKNTVKTLNQIITNTSLI